MDQIIITIFMIFFISVICYAIVSDFRSFIIPNWVSYSLALGFIVFAALYWQKLPVSQHLMLASVVFVVGLIFFLLGWMGAADTKLITAVVLWAGPQQAFPFVFYMAVLGAVFALCLIALGQIVKVRPAFGANVIILGRVMKFAERKVLPYGIPIGIAALLTVPHFFLTFFS